MLPYLFGELRGIGHPRPSLGFIMLILLTGSVAFHTPLPAQTQIIRIMSANTTSGNNQSYRDPGNRIFDGLHPDIVLIQEFNIYINSSEPASTACR
jgi:hypothetical protein